MTVGYIEAKDVASPLDTVERSEQLERYRRALPNLILTDYLEFRWYVDGDLRTTARLGRLVGRAVAVDPMGLTAVADLLTSFLARAALPIATPAELASRLARLARLTHDVILEDFAAGTASPAMRDLLEGFRTTLLPDMTHEQFADALSQSLAYGLFAARVYHRGAAPFRRQDAARDIPRTNPFMRQLFGAITGPSLDDEPFVGFVDDTAALLADADIDAILANFGTRTRRQDPVVHFYETFLAQYDPRLREARGVYYTPEPVVSFIVRSVDELLIRDFALADGFADTAQTTWERQTEQGTVIENVPRVLVLDPATGTGTFPYMIIDEIRHRFSAGGNAGQWAAYVHDQLLPRINALELLVAPYVVAHLKLALQLAGLDLPVAERATWSYDFQQDERLRVFLTNSLDEATAPAGVIFARYISDEANAASAVKRDMPIMVVLGNPPYSGHSVNNSQWILELLADYYQVDGVRIREANTKWLRDDYVKFIRFGQWRIERTGVGVLAYITNHRYLRNPTFRGMRQQLLRAFDKIYVLNLHGNRRMGERAPDGSADENVFDIEQGVAIGIFVRDQGNAEPARVFHAHLYGNRTAKYEYLDDHGVIDVPWNEVTPEAPDFLFEPRDPVLQVEFSRGISVEDAFPVHSLGLLTKRDGLAIAMTRAELLDKVGRFANPRRSDEDVAAEFGLPMTDLDRWDLHRARQAIRAVDAKRAERILYRPFDWRWVYMDANIVARPNTRVLDHMRQPNFALLAGRQGESTGAEWDHAWGSDRPSEQNVFARGGATVFPLYLYPDPDGLGLIAGRTANIAPGASAEFAGALGMTWIPDGAGDLVATVGPEDFFFYVYGIVFSPTYRSRYEENLANDFPHIPISTNPALVREVVALGRQLFGLHALNRTVAPRPTSTFPVAGSNVVEPRHPRYVAAGASDPYTGGVSPDGRLYINRTLTRPARAGQLFANVAEESWEFGVGGFEPGADWLAARRGRALQHADLEHAQWMFEAMKAAVAVAAEVDGVIDANGGWPLT